MAKFTGRERIHLAAGICGWSLSSRQYSDLMALSKHRWIRVHYDRLGRVIRALDHAQIGDGGPMIEHSLEPGPDRADQVIGWLSRLR